MAPSATSLSLAMRYLHGSMSVCLLADVLVLGTGTKVKKVDPAILSYLHRKGISVEIQDTVRRDWSLVRYTAR